MSVRYLVRGTKDGNWSKPLRLLAAARMLRKRLRERGESFVIHRKGGGASAPRDLAGTVERLKALLAKEPVGETYIVRGRLDLDPVQVRIIEDAPPPAGDICGIPAVKAFAGWVREKWPHARFAGSCVCKFTTGTTWSDHAYGGAIDYFDTWTNMEAMVGWSIANAEELDLKYVILGDHIWSRLNGWTKMSYGGSYHWHGHWSFNHGSDRIACA